MTFEELILKAKEAGHGWTRAPRSGGDHAVVQCADGRCVLGALIHKAGISPGDALAMDGTDDYGDPIPADSLDVPEPAYAARVLGIPVELAERIVCANDNVAPSILEDITLLDQLLGITANA